MVLGHIGAAVGEQPLDHGAHLADMLGRARFDGRREHAERTHICVELRLGLLGDLADRLVQRQVRIVLRGARVDLVVHVGDVADIGDMLGAVDVPQQTEQHVEDDDGPRIADMGVVVDRRPAHIEAHMRRIEGPKRLLPAGERIVKRKRH